MNIRCLLLLLFLSWRCDVFPQDSARFTPGQKRMMVLQGSLYGGSLAALATAWYKEPRSPFHLFDDHREWMGMDKAGHTTTAYHLVRINRLLLESVHLSAKKSMNLALVSSISYLSLIEVMDGYAPGYGASLYDAGFNLGGAALYYLQYRTGTERYFTLKYSYRKSGLAGYRPELLGQNVAERLLKDYNAQTYWLSLNLSAVTGSKKIPHWLNLAVGYSAHGMLGGEGNPAVNQAGAELPAMKRTRQLAFSLDIQTESLFRKHKTLNRIFSVFSFIKIPFPTLVYSRGHLGFFPVF